MLDWPEDKQGQFQDGDNATFATVATSAGQPTTAADSYGDTRLIPMLEIKIPAGDTNLPSQADLSPYKFPSTTWAPAARWPTCR